MVALDIHVLLCNRDQINLEICRNLFIEFILKLNFSFLLQSFPTLESYGWPFMGLYSLCPEHSSSASAND